jgi:hypothetical protein
MKTMKDNQSIVQMTRWCDEQEVYALDTINHLLDTNKHKTKVGKKALTIASEILKGIEMMRETLNQELTK